MRAVQLSNLMVIRFGGNLFPKSSVVPYCPVLNLGNQLMCLLLPWDSSFGLRVPYRGKLVSCCPCAADGETEAQQKGSVCLCSACNGSSAGLEIKPALVRLYPVHFPVDQKCIK